MEKGIAGIATAFRGIWQIAPGGPSIALLAEYDALPGLGHACGHNLICAASIGAALALKTVLTKNPLPGQLQVIGTPGEENGGGKILMLQRGIFANLDAAMMFHPGNQTVVLKGALAAVRIKMTFHGKSAHASTSPHEGINALDACIQTFNSINSLRQHLRDEVRIHGIINKGGVAPNIVPDLAEAEFMLRSKTVAYLQVMLAKVKNAATASAAAMGATVDFEESVTYAERKLSKVLASLFAVNLVELGAEVSSPTEIGGLGSSDIGNVSQVLPALHPYIAVAPPGVPAHTPEFREFAGREEGIEGMILGAKALAMTILDLLSDPRRLAAAKREFSQN